MKAQPSGPWPPSHPVSKKRMITTAEVCRAPACVPEAVENLIFRWCCGIEQIQPCTQWTRQAYNTQHWCLPVHNKQYSTDRHKLASWLRLAWGGERAKNSSRFVASYKPLRKAPRKNIVSPWQYDYPPWCTVHAWECMNGCHGIVSTWVFFSRFAKRGLLKILDWKLADTHTTVCACVYRRVFSFWGDESCWRHDPKLMTCFLNHG